MTREHHFNTDLIQQIEYLINTRPGQISALTLMQLIASLGGYISRIALELDQIYQVDNSVTAQSEQILLLARLLTVQREFKTPTVTISLPQVMQDAQQSIGVIILESDVCASQLPLDISPQYSENVSMLASW